MDVVNESENLMAEYMKSYDPSHDIYHVQRVRRTAEKIALSLSADMLVVQLGAIFHDLVDHKYQTSQSRVDEVVKLFQRHKLPAQTIQEVTKIIHSVGYSQERKLKAAGKWTEWHESCKEFHCVSDADRLDAMGAIGMFRASAYSVVINQPLANGSGSAYEHIEEKLLKLHSTLRTPKGKELGANRHQFMIQFRQQIENEIMQ